MTTTGNSSSSRSRSGLTLTASVVIVVVCVVSCLVARACGSAIPMWEFLTREEKLSHLYRIFSQEVSEHCSESTMPDCNKNLLISGLKNLANLDDDKLDEMDPYQRGAKDIIWSAIVGNGGNSRHQASRLGQHSFHANEDDPLAVGDNELPEESKANKDYAHPSDHSGPYLTGPMVIRVYPDGRPVPKDAQRPLPKDEDIEDIRYSARLPSIKDIESSKKSSSLTTTAAKELVKRYEPATEILPPRRMQVRSSNVYQWYQPMPAQYQQQQQARFYPRQSVAIPPPNSNLLVRERFY